MAELLPEILGDAPFREVTLRPVARGLQDKHLKDSPTVSESIFLPQKQIRG